MRCLVTGNVSVPNVSTTTGKKSQSIKVRIHQRFNASFICTFIILLTKRGVAATSHIITTVHGFSSSQEICNHKSDHQYKHYGHRKEYWYTTIIIITMDRRRDKLWQDRNFGDAVRTRETTHSFAPFRCAVASSRCDFPGVCWHK